MLSYWVIALAGENHFINKHKNAVEINRIANSVDLDEMGFISIYTVYWVFLAKRLKA